MGHNIMHYTYKHNVNKRKVQDELDSYVRHADWQEGASGLPNPIRWLNVTLDSYEEAEKYIKEHDNDWYDQIAVMYYENHNLKPSKTYETLKERAERLNRRYMELRDKIHYADVKSKFITCRYCDSKISVAVLSGKLKSWAYWGKRNNCPVCGRDLRPESTLALIETAKKNAEKAAKDLKAEEKKLMEKQKKNAEIKWLVKIEYHT